MYCDGKEGYDQFYTELVKILDEQDKFLADAEMELAMTEAMDAAEVFIFQSASWSQVFGCRDTGVHPT